MHCNVNSNTDCINVAKGLKNTLHDSMKKTKKLQVTAHLILKGLSSCQGLYLPCPVKDFSANTTTSESHG